MDSNVHSTANSRTPCFQIKVEAAHTDLEMRFMELEAKQAAQQAKQQAQETALANVTSECLRLQEQVSALEARLAMTSTVPVEQGENTNLRAVDVCNTVDTMASEVPVKQEEHTNMRAVDVYKTVDAMATEACAFDGTVWDAMLFIGYRDVGCLGSLYILLLFLLNGITQSMFIFIVFFAMINDDFSKQGIQSLIRWRLDVGHSINFVSESTEQTLVARVCSGEESLNVATSQLNMLDIVVHYILQNYTDPFRRYIGPIMCLLALFIWSLTCAKEANRVKSLFVAFIAAPRGPDTVFLLDGQEKTLEFHTISFGRKVIATLVLFVRLLFSGTLLAAGIHYLCNTFKLEELLLNAVALELVLNIDEAIFDGLAPLHLRNFLSSIKPLTSHRKWQRSGIDLQGSLRFVLIGLVLGFSYVFRISPNIFLLQEAYNSICAGNQDFAFGSTAGPPFFAWSFAKPSTPRVAEIAPAKYLSTFQPLTWRDLMIKNIIISGADIQDPQALETFTPILRHTVTSLQSLVSQSVEEATYDINPFCGNVGQTIAAWELQNIGDQVGHKVGPACVADGEWHRACYEDSLFGQLSRLYCSALCECYAAHLPQLLGDKGCPQECTTHDGFHSHQKVRLCQDLSMAQLAHQFPEDYRYMTENLDEPGDDDDPWRLESKWSEVANNFLKATNSYARSQKEKAMHIWQQLSKFGCRGIARLRSQEGINLCSHLSSWPGFRVFRFYCPKSCQCEHLEHHDFCPESCWSDEIDEEAGND